MFFMCCPNDKKPQVNKNKQNLEIMRENEWALECLKLIGIKIRKIYIKSNLIKKKWLP